MPKIPISNLDRFTKDYDSTKKQIKKKNKFKDSNNNNDYDKRPKDRKFSSNKS